MKYAKFARTGMLLAGATGALAVTALIAHPQNTRPPVYNPKFFPANPILQPKPPRIKRAMLQMLDGPALQGNSRLTLQFEEGQRVEPVLTLNADGQRLQIRDDGKAPDLKAGDGVFSGIVKVDAGELQRFSDRLTSEAKARQIEAVPVFQQREVVGRAAIKPLDVAGFRQRQNIVLFPFPIGLPTVIDPAKSLLITDTKVTEDPTRTFNACTKTGKPMGTWTFGHLMREMANQPVTGIDPRKFVRQWVEKWKTDQPVNGDTAPARININADIIQPWEAASGVTPGGLLDLSKAPFKLLAIVNRVDLRQNPFYGGTSAGEARFVFGAMDMRPGHGCAPLQMTVIFEYGVRQSGCMGIKNWGQQWVSLQSKPLGSPAYNAALEAITEQFVKAGADPSKLPNKSALNQLRTDDIALSFPWELREFQIASAGPGAGHLQEVTVKQTPADHFNNTTTLADYVNTFTPTIVVDNYKVPDDFPPGKPFLGDHSLSGPPQAFWHATSIGDNNARFHFSLNTCNGCHARETNTSFTHIHPAAFGSPAGLSGFLTGINVNDPVVPATVHHFNDLQRRAIGLDSLVNAPCIFQIFFEPLHMVH